MAEKCDCCKDEKDCEKVGELNICQDCIDHAYSAVEYPKQNKCDKFKQIDDCEQICLRDCTEEIRKSNICFIENCNACDECPYDKFREQEQTCGNCGNYNSGNCFPESPDDGCPGMPVNKEDKCIINSWLSIKETCGNCGHPHISEQGIRWCNEDSVVKEHGANVFVLSKGSCKVNPSKWKPEEGKG